MVCHQQCVGPDIDEGHHDGQYIVPKDYLHLYFLPPVLPLEYEGLCLKLTGLLSHMLFIVLIGRIHKVSRKLLRGTVYGY